MPEELKYCYRFIESALDRLKALEELALELKLIRAYLQQHEMSMDKQIHKIEKSEKKALKDTKKLLKMDKKFDAKLEKCGAMKKGKKS